MNFTKFAARYAGFRGSVLFLIALVAFVAIWVSAHLMANFDRGFGILNLILSLEASLSVALLIMANQKQEELERKQDALDAAIQIRHAENLQRMAELVTTVRDQITVQADMVRAIHASIANTKASTDASDRLTESVLAGARTSGPAQGPGVAATEGTGA